MSFRFVIAIAGLVLSAASFSVAAVSPSKAERIADRGYIVKTSKNRFYFVRDPKVIEPGVEVEASAIKKADLCILENRGRIDCPSQEISFSLKRGGRGVLMTNLRLEQDTAWHRLNRAQKAFAP